jgi:hypothetical protein
LALIVMRHNEMTAVGLTAVLYAALRLANGGRAPDFVQHWFGEQLVE